MESEGGEEKEEGRGRGGEKEGQGQPFSVLVIKLFQSKDACTLVTDTAVL